MDIDGVLVEPVGYNPLVERFVPDWDKFIEDIPKGKPIQEGLILLNSLLATNHRVHLVSGRPERCRLATLDWFVDEAFVLLKDKELILRPSEEHEDPSNYKVEVCKRIRPDLVIEDDLSIVKDLVDEGFNVMAFIRKGWNR